VGAHAYCTAIFFALTYDLKPVTFYPVRAIQTLEIMYIDSPVASYHYVANIFITHPM
jgi:hypothetical protein